MSGIAPEISSSHLYCVQFWFSFGWCHWYHCESKGDHKTRVLPIGEVPYPITTRANAHNTLSSPTSQPQQTLKQLNFEHSLKTKKKKGEIEKYIHIPQATKLPVGAYAHVMTHDERRGMACTCTARKRHAVKNIGRLEFNRTTTKTVLFCVKSGTAQKTKTNLVGGVSIPNDQFSILRCTHKIPAHWSRKRHRESLGKKKKSHRPHPLSNSFLHFLVKKTIVACLTVNPSPNALHKFSPNGPATFSACAAEYDRWCRHSRTPARQMSPRSSTKKKEATIHMKATNRSMAGPRKPNSACLENMRTTYLNQCGVRGHFPPILQQQHNRADTMRDFLVPSHGPDYHNSYQTLTLSPIKALGAQSTVVRSNSQQLNRSAISSMASQRLTSVPNAQHLHSMQRWPFFLLLS